MLFIEIGRRIGARHLAADPEGARTGIGAIEGAVFGLLALLIAFTFSGAATRMDTRRTLIVEETNAMGTAFRDYVDARIAYYRDLTDVDLASRESVRANALQQDIWKQAIAGLQQMPTPTLGVSLLQALNAMIDITTTRSVALETHPPLIIYLMLIALTQVSALFIGYGMAGSVRHNWLHIFGYALVMVCVLYVILDFEFPRLGIIAGHHPGRPLRQDHAGLA